MDYLKKGEVNISMEGYLCYVLCDFTYGIIRRVKKPMDTQLFEFQNCKEQVLL